MVSLLAFIVLIGVLITVHEAGHFVVAKLSGVKVEVFSIGFGRAILSKRIGETEYRIALFPVGGYVQMLGMSPEQSLSTPEAAQPPAPSDTDGAAAPGQSAPHPDEGRDLFSKPPLVRIAIFLAGPAMNLILPLFILLPVFLFGERGDQVVDNVVGAVDEGLPAHEAGLRDGDRIVAIGGQPAQAFWQISRAVSGYSADDGPLSVQVERQRLGQEGTETLDFSVQPRLLERTDRRVNFSRQSWYIGFQPSALAADVALLGADSALAQAGVQTFDRVLAVGGRPIARYTELVHALMALAPGQQVALQIERDEPIDPQLSFLVAQRSRELLYTAPAQPRDGRAVGLAHAGNCIRSVAPESSAGQKLRVGDCILEVNGQRHSLGAFIQSELNNAPSQPKHLKIRRGTAELELTIEPQRVVHSDPFAGEIEQWQLGLVLFGRPDSQVAPTTVANGQRWGYAWHTSVEQLSYELKLTLSMVTGLFSGRVSPTQLSGPITIAAVAGQYAKAGLEAFLQLMIMLSLSIGLLNLLPVPGLDGGHILVASIELVVRRPLSLRARQMLQVVGAVMILLLILFVTGNDLLRQWRLHVG